MKNNTSLINKYVFYNDIYDKNGIYLLPKSHIFKVFDKDSDPDTRYCWCIRSVTINKLELWVKRTQLVFLTPAEEESVKLLYEKN